VGADRAGVSVVPAALNRLGRLGGRAWDELVDLLRKNKTHLGSSRLRSDLPLTGPVPHAAARCVSSATRFRAAHTQTRANRALAAELDFLIDRIVFRLFDLTLDEQRLILPASARPPATATAWPKKNQSKQKAEGRCYI